MRIWGRVGDVRPPRGVQSLSVEPTKPRLCVNGRPLNPCYGAPHPNMDGFGQLAGTMEPGSHAGGFDHKSGYFHVPLAPHSMEYLAFEYDGVFMVFTVLPFGYVP